VRERAERVAHSMAWAIYVSRSVYKLSRRCASIVPHECRMFSTQRQRMRLRPSKGWSTMSATMCCSRSMGREQPDAELGKAGGQNVDTVAEARDL